MLVVRLTALCACLLAIVACGSDHSSPAAPSPPALGDPAGANPDGSTLKVSAPTGLVPANGERAGSVRPLLGFTNAVARFGPAALSYRVEVFQGTSLIDTIVGVQDIGSTTYARPTRDLQGDTRYRWRVRAELDGAVGPWSAPAEFMTPSGFLVFGPRAPDPPPGQRLPFPNYAHVVHQVAAQYPQALRNSCQSHGGSWEFMDRLVAELRRQDSRFAYNAKRGNFGDPSHDVIFYHWGAGPSEGSKQGYVIDILLGHCGPTPAPAWIDQSTITFNSNTTGGYLYPRPGMTELPGGPPADALPLPNEAALVRQLGDQFAADLRNSCEEQGGNWVWLDRVVDTLRAKDPRWGYNGKHGDASKPAPDEIAYHWGTGPRQGSPDVYLIDIIESHCGTPRAGWRNFTGSERGVWTDRQR